MTDETNEIPDWWQPYAAQFPRWHAWQGVNSLFYASIRRSSPPIVCRGESPEDLADEIVRAEADIKAWREAR